MVQHDKGQDTAGEQVDGGQGRRKRMGGNIIPMGRGLGKAFCRQASDAEYINN